MTQTTQKIYFIPGTMCDERLWTKTWEALAIMLPAHYVYEHIHIPALTDVDKITRKISEQLPNNSYLVGFSLGGYLASNIALQCPDKVKKLLLISNMSSSLPEKETKERSRTIQWIEANGYNGIPDKRINHLLHPNNHNNEAIKHVIKNMDKTLGKEVLLHQLKVTTQRENLLPKLFSLKQPLKFLVGDKDNLVNIEKIEYYLEHLSNEKKYNKQIEVLSHTGHMLPLEQPVYLAQTISSWFTNIDTNISTYIK